MITRNPVTSSRTHTPAPTHLHRHHPRLERGDRGPHERRVPVVAADGSLCSAGRPRHPRVVWSVAVWRRVGFPENASAATRPESGHFDLAVRGRACTESQVCAQESRVCGEVLPASEGSACRRTTPDRLAAGAHRREERLDPVNTVPEQIRLAH
jgi:hypothetical protein